MGVSCRDGTTEHPPARKHFIRAASRGVVAGKRCRRMPGESTAVPAAGVRLAGGAGRAPAHETSFSPEQAAKPILSNFFLSRLSKIRGICDPAASDTDALSRLEVRVCLPAARLEPWWRETVASNDVRSSFEGASFRPLRVVLHGSTTKEAAKHGHDRTLDIS